MSAEQFNCPVVTNFKNNEGAIVSAVQYTGSNVGEIKKIAPDGVRIGRIILIDIPKEYIVVKDSVGDFSIWRPSAFQVMFQPITE